ncbi:MAG: hypothetical protein HC849_27080 [Oscillatoriales cyanobacterium RU_3_3]|nr:hypothetical protein [Microcoleus sp. SU_5_6]NJM63016.1 hypothetical protein [Oscillatoriales cyanobacterium RU_3_3]NJR21720.1 hypothetical protein [Richelia sp. CSU_2_1]
MMQEAIFIPFFATVFLTLLVWVYMYIRRISFITSRKLSQKDLTLALLVSAIIVIRRMRYLSRSIEPPLEYFDRLPNICTIADRDVMTVSLL